MLFFFECILFLIIMAYMVNNYSAKDIPLYLKSLVFFCWSLSFIILIVIPLDIYYVNKFKSVSIPRRESKQKYKTYIPYYVLGYSNINMDFTTSCARLRTKRILLA